MTSSTAPTAPAPTLRGPGRRGLGRYAATAALHTAALAVLYVVCVRTARGQAAEDAVHRLALDSPDAGLPAPAERLLDLAGRLEPHHLLAGAALVALAGLARRAPGRAALGLGVAAGTLGLTELLKLVLLERPNLLEAYAGGGNSLPSGHTAGVLGVCLGLLVAAPPRWRVLLAPLGALASGAMGAMVVADGWHRVSDPLASALVGTAVLALAHALPWGRRGRWLRGRPAPGTLAALAAGVPAACALALVAAYAWPGAGLGVAVAAPGLAVAATVLLAATALPREVRARG
ncbi:phosphatase PAP2 family protein [Kineococcus auxinigenes]|uniref:phosphatase PAP2 family protein n=1 Tax=unclassified Kineococcus TaxID=2621656 RepID=UPI003D7D1B9A